MTTITNFSRHKQLFDPENFNTPVTVLGAGATGSFLVLFLAKLGIKNITCQIKCLDCNILANRKLKHCMTW